MITRCKVKNFKSIRDEEDLEIRPLTIFTGANSSGKSTFIQSILLVAQTVIHKQIALQSVVLNGSFMSFGQFDDIRHNDSTLEKISVMCTFKPLESQLDMRSYRRYPYNPRFISLDEISCDITFTASTSHFSQDLAQIRPLILSSYLSCNFTETDRPSRIRKMNKPSRKGSKSDSEIYHEAYISIKNPAKHTSKKSKNLRQHYRDALICSIELDENSKNEILNRHSTAEPIGCIIRHFIPESVVCNINETEESIRNIANILHKRSSRIRYDYDFDVYFDKVTAALEELLEDKKLDIKKIFKGIRTFEDVSYEEYMKIQNALSNLSSKSIYDAIKSKIKDTSKSEKSYISNDPVPIPAALNHASRYIDQTFSSSFKYLGPLRDAPRSLYPLSPSTEPSDVGLRGEHTAAAIELCKDNIVTYIPSENFKGNEVKVKVVTTSLENALSDWIQYLEIAKSVEILNRGKQGRAMKVGISDARKRHELTHVGVGVSQVLPILVMGLLASRDTTLVFEQPELHLHPNVQFLLGDFFLSLALCDKQCIVESHSEHLIDQIRFRIAASSSDDNLNDLAKVYFAKKSSKSSTFEEIKINEYGKIADWPEGFFDQSFHVASRIMKAAAKKQRKSLGKKDVKSN